MLRSATFVIMAFMCFVHAFGIGYVKVRNFPKEAYAGGSQNWALVQDSVGKIYAGNRDGMLVYDGERWKKYYLPNYTTVRSLMFDQSDGRIYAGGSEEFGYFEPDAASGMLLYTSLLDCFPATRPGFSEIWRIYKAGENIWFQADNYLFCYHDGSLRIYPADGRISASSLIGRDIYIALEDGRVMKMANGVFAELNKSDILRGKKVTAILPVGSSGALLIGTSMDGLYRFDGDEVRPYQSDVNQFLRSNQLFCASASGNSILFGTVNSGAVWLDLATGRATYINKETGLQNNTVLNASFDRMGNLWLCLDNGLDYAMINSPVTSLVSRNSSIGAGYASMLVGGRMIFGTNQGLYSTPYPYPPSPVPDPMLRELQGQIWSINPTAHGVLVASDAGIYVYASGGSSHVEGSRGAYKAIPVPGHPDLVLASTYESFRLLKFENGKWRDDGAVGGYADINGSFVFGSDGSVWMPHWRKGIYRLKFDPDSRTFVSSRLFSTDDGFPTSQNNTVAEFDGQIVFSTQYGFYKFDEKSKKPIVPDNELNEAFAGQRNGLLQNLPDGSLALVDFSGIYIASRRADGTISVRRASTGSLRDELIPGYTHINYISPSELVVSTQDGFTAVNPQQFEASSWMPQPMFSAVLVNRDSVVYASSTLPRGSAALKLPYELNSVRFEFAYPDFTVGAGVEYSSYLENYEADWTPFSADAVREYTRLAEGDYTMRLRVRDIATGEMRQASICLRIDPPWFRTPLAKALYALGAILFLGLLVGFIRKWAENARRKLELRKESELQALRAKSEQEAIVKDYEIASLKTEQLEQDIKHKSQELSSTAMNLIRKNEMLSDIAAQISNIQKLAAAENSRAAVQRQLAKIRSSIESSISGDNDWNAFNKNFDIVYGDYTKRLLEIHPNLSPADKRLCCYIRMGLSSKEIAPLINISCKSVEMARYRLRKKISLPAETSLTEYLTNL